MRVNGHLDDIFGGKDRKKNDNDNVNDNFFMEHGITSLRSLTHYLCSLRYVHKRHKNVQR